MRDLITKQVQESIRIVSEDLNAQIPTLLETAQQMCTQELDLASGSHASSSRRSDFERDSGYHSHEPSETSQTAWNSTVDRPLESEAPPRHDLVDGAHESLDQTMATTSSDVSSFHAPQYPFVLDTESQVPIFPASSGSAGGDTGLLQGDDCLNSAEEHQESQELFDTDNPSQDEGHNIDWSEWSPYLTINPPDNLDWFTL